MTILGKHTVSETRDLIKAIEFRANQYLKQLELIRRSRAPQLTLEQQQLDNDMGTFMRRWTDVRDKQTVIMTAAVFANPTVPPFLLPAEGQFVAVTKAATRDDPRLIDLNIRIDKEGDALGLPRVDLAQTPQQNSPDADFATLQGLDKAIAAAGDPLGKPGGSDSVLRSPLGLALIGGAVVGVAAGGLYVKKVFF